MNAPHLDLSTPSVAAARHLAHLECLAHGPEAAKALMAKLLLHVDETEGGLLGADEWRVSVVRKRFGISVEQYMSALYAPGHWPVLQVNACERKEALTNRIVRLAAER